MTGRNKGRTIVCAGRVYCDMIFTGLDEYPKLGEETYAQGLAVEPGGGAFITAANLHHLGEHAMLLASLPGGPFGAAIYPKLNGSRIDMTLAPYNPANPPQLTAAITYNNDRAFLTKRNDRAVSKELLDTFGSTPAQHLHIGELSTVLEQPELLAIAKAKGMSISLDCAWDAKSFTHPNVNEVLQQIDVFLPNELEAKTLGILENVGAHTPLSVVKQGEFGATAIHNGAAVSVTSTQVDALDATGAGDAFNAGFLSAWLDGASLETCLRRGNECGAAAVQRIGGAPRHKKLCVS